MPAPCGTDTDVKTRFSSRSTQQQAVQTLLTWVAASSTRACALAAGGSLRSIPSSRCKRSSAGGIAARGISALGKRSESWWSQTGSNRRPPACKAGALPTELWPRRRSQSDRSRKPHVRNQRVDVWLLTSDFWLLMPDNGGPR